MEDGLKQEPALDIREPLVLRPLNRTLSTRAGGLKLVRAALARGAESRERKAGHVDSNPHCHVLISPSDDEERAWLFGEDNKGWLWLHPRGQFEISEIEAPRRAISYITKEIYEPDSQDQLFIYQAPLSKPANSNSVEPTSDHIDLAAVHRRSPSKWL